jgi:hypothetical protein
MDGHRGIVSVADYQMTSLVQVNEEVEEYTAERTSDGKEYILEVWPDS